ncbi:Ribose-5-phosphate isomerase B (plasmid) [Klebsiella pneumoniae]|nr:Ribose-5-phosphate isomerase B [Klebsiella pneumoniae]
MKTKIAIASDDVGFERKEEIKKYLVEEKGAQVVYDPVKCKEDGVNNFARLADEMAGVIQRDECRLGIYICGTGIGFTCQVNKHWGYPGCCRNEPVFSKTSKTKQQCPGDWTWLPG